MNNKTTLKDVINCLKIGSHICKEFMIAAFIKSIMKSILPFVTIIFSYLILDGLIDKIASSTIYLYAFLMIGLNFVIGIIIKICNYFTSKYGNVIEYKITKSLCDKSYTLDYSQAEDSETMSLVQKAREGSNSNGGLQDLYTTFFDRVLATVLSIIYALILLSGLFIKGVTTSTDKLASIINNPASILLVFFVLIVATIASTLISAYVNKENYKVMMANIELNRRYSYLYSICSNYQYGKDIRLFSMQKMIHSIMIHEKTSSNAAWLRVVRLSIRMQILSNVFYKLLLLASYAYVGIKAYYGLVSIGNVVSYVSAITLLGTSISTLLSGYLQTKQQTSYLKNYFTYLNLPSRMAYGEKVFNDKDIEVEFKDVSFVYPKQEGETISNISFKINKGEKLALVGQNGAGKTTIIKLLCRLYEPTSGDIYINGTNIKEYTRESLYDIFSVVFQDFKLFSYSIKENIGCGTEADETKVLDSLEKAGIKERVERMEKGIDTIIYNKNEEKGVEISGGEAQKIALARALYKGSPLVILDEPTSALDPVSEADIYSHFKDMVKDKTSIFISHRMSSCKFCDRIIVLDKGMIEEVGTHDELVKNHGVYKKMWDAQAKYYN